MTTATVEAENAKEEIEEIVSNCIRCGMCKSLCPVFSIMREETVSPRGKAIILDKKVYDKVVYECSLCKACEQKCPLGLKLCDAFRKARKVLVEQGKETKENREMIKNVKEFGNPFGRVSGKKLDKLYCC
ncbi:MAG: 4Fe-4S dicluster domain-containing protein [Nanoarchaeota archaeon]|nr:4Fe-4S dicluster domain-containing protein [Nanoarchaeota archaeon]MBU4086129.1 4Fe-4S dicluster domain-containing protein [Nanoarchaeota archaeon]